QLLLILQPCGAICVELLDVLLAEFLDHVAAKLSQSLLPLLSEPGPVLGADLPLGQRGDLSRRNLRCELGIVLGGLSVGEDGNFAVRLLVIPAQLLRELAPCLSCPGPRLVVPLAMPRTLAATESRFEDLFGSRRLRPAHPLVQVFIQADLAAGELFSQLVQIIAGGERLKFLCVR